MNPLYRQGAHQNQTKDLESFDIKNIKKKHIHLRVSIGGGAGLPIRALPERIELKERKMVVQVWSKTMFFTQTTLQLWSEKL
jgi:hypothetical protein